MLRETMPPETEAAGITLLSPPLSTPRAESAGSGQPLSRIILGTAWLHFQPDHERNLDTIYELGCTVFDTARSYGDGAAESMLGAWLRTRGLRHRVTLASKGGHPSPGRSRLGRADLWNDLTASLLALRTDVIDIYFLHRDDVTVPVIDVLETLNAMVDKGHVKKFGVSNWTAARIAEAQDAALANGMRGFSVSSPQYSLAEWKRAPWPGCVTVAGESKRPEREWYSATQLPLFAWSSLAGGFMSGLDPEVRFQAKLSFPEKACADIYDSPANRERWRRAARVAGEMQSSTPCVALAYVLNQTMNVHAIVSSSASAHLAANLKAASIKLSANETAWLNLESDTSPYE
jgi:aryl-alcohol dehydrogenase-like predicted oxidoreductase